MTKYCKHIYDGCSVLEIICDDLKEFRKELAFLRKLKIASSKSYNPIIETDYGDDGVGFEFCRMFNNSTVRIMFRGC